jgi:hypothetical protein
MTVLSDQVRVPAPRRSSGASRIRLPLADMLGESVLTCRLPAFRATRSSCVHLDGVTISVYPRLRAVQPSTPIRFAVGGSVGPRSQTWMVVSGTTDSDVFLGLEERTRTMRLSQRRVSWRLEYTSEWARRPATAPLTTHPVLRCLRVHAQLLGELDYRSTLPPNSRSSSPTIATARSWTSTGYFFVVAMPLILSRTNGLQEPRGSPLRD